MSRREFSKRTKRDAFLRCNGRCEDCGAKLTLGKYEFDHDIADGLLGEPTLENCKVRCTPCHKAKTRVDVALIAKAKRRSDRHAGITAPKRPLQGRGFAPTAKQARATAPIAKALPPRRALFTSTAQG